MKTQLSKPARSKARYTDEYKEQALQLWGQWSQRAKVAASTIKLLKFSGVSVVLYGA